jgi:ribosomal protein S18 acetylase RimI-like enzyme
MKMEIRRALTADAPALSTFAARTFEETFGHSTSAEDMAQHLATAYGPAIQLAEISDPDMTTLLGEIDGRLAAFAMLRPGETPSSMTLPGPIELWRFYVSPEWHGKGIAHELMGEVLSVARSRGAQSMWLGVWENNYRAQAFYRKHGFGDVGFQVYLVGTDAQTDRIFARLL